MKIDILLGILKDKIENAQYYPEFRYDYLVDCQYYIERCLKEMNNEMP